MIVDSHMHVGDFPLFDVAMDRDGLVEEMREYDISTGLVFHPDNALVRTILADTPGVYCLVWADPLRPPHLHTALVHRRADPPLSGRAYHPRPHGPRQHHLHQCGHRRG